MLTIPDQLLGEDMNDKHPPMCEFCQRTIAECDADTEHGCGTGEAKEETWRDRPSQA